MPLGRDSNRLSSARVIASTHVDLWELQQKEIFRQDLHYRLRTHHIVLPPLRERKEDIGLLVGHFARMRRPGPEKTRAEDSPGTDRNAGVIPFSRQYP